MHGTANVKLLAFVSCMWLVVCQSQIQLLHTELAILLHLMQFRLCDSHHRQGMWTFKTVSHDTNDLSCTKLVATSIVENFGTYSASLNINSPEMSGHF